MKRRITAGVVALVCANAFARDIANEITPSTIVAMMNVYRVEAGLVPLRLDPQLTAAADDRMQDMEDGAWWSHDSPDGRSPFQWLAVRHYDYRAAGENLAAGFETVGVLVSAWMDSPGHRANIMGREYEDCGIAVIDGSTRGRANGKSIVVLFGVKRYQAQTRASMFGQ